MIEIKMGMLGRPAELIMVANKLDPLIGIHPKPTVINHKDEMRINSGSLLINPLI